MSANTNQKQVTKIEGEVVAVAPEGATEQQKQNTQAVINASKRNLLAHDVTQAIVQLFEPLVTALDLKPSTATGDHGHTLPSQADNGIRIVIGQLCNNVHRQLKGEIRTPNGNIIPNALDRVKQSDAQISEMKARYSDDPAAMQNDVNFFTIAYWLNVNETRYSVLEELLDGFKAAYKEIVGEEWTPVLAQNVQAIKPSTAMADALKAAMAKRDAAKAAPTE